jgi:serine/threonine protein kinase
MRTVSHYELLEKLGEGGMGVVWKGRDTRLERFVAIKFLPPDRTADPERKRRFIQEARAASALNHPRIITIYDIDHAEGADFIVMEYVSGKTLEQLIPAKGMKVPEAVRYAMQIADALAAAHAAGIVHRDLKPANIMVSDSGQVKVLDFGLAKLQEQNSSTEVENTRTIKQIVKTEEGTIVGSTCYMSPEQAEGNKVDARSDIFSFGSVLYEMLTGKRAFRGETKMATLAAVLRADPEPLDKLAEGVPRELARIVQRCLRKDPEDRAQSMADLRIALKEIKEESESGLLAPESTPARKRRSKWFWAAGIAALIFVAGSAYVFATWKSEPDIPMQAALLTSYPGREGTPSFSPDGNQVAFTWNGQNEDNYDIYVKLLGPGKPLRLTTDPASDVSPEWSPDGRSIAFFRQRSLLTIPPIGGNEREVAQADFYHGNRTGSPDRSITWSPDSRFLVASLRETAGQGPYGVFLLSLKTGEKRRLTSPQKIGVGDDLSAAISPDGRTLAFVKLVSQGTPLMSDSDLYTLPLGSDYSPKGEPRRITFGKSTIGGLAWTADSREIVFSWYKGPSPSLWRVAVSGSPKPVKLTVGDNGGAPNISHQGNRLAYEQTIPSSGYIWRYDLTDPSQNPTAVTASTRGERSPQYSPDGREIVFNSERSGISAIWNCDADGGNVVQLTEMRASGSPAWSPDGQTIAFDSIAESKWQIFTISAHGGQPKQLTSGGSHSRPSWSHDGSWIYSSGGGGIQKIPAGGGTPIQLTNGSGSTNPMESPDGKTIYYQTNAAIRKVGADGSGDQLVTDDPNGESGIAVTSDGIYYVFLEQRWELRFYRFATGRSTTIRVVDKPPMLGIAVSPDHHWLLLSQVDRRATADLMLVDPFR